MLLADQTTSMAVQTVAIIAPVAMYFFVLGLLNSRATPQVVTSRTDFFVMVILVAPAFLLPMLSIIGAGWGLSLAVVLLIGGLVWIAGASPGSWVIYNVPESLAHRVVSQILGGMGRTFSRAGDQYGMADGGITVTVTSFAMLRNVSVRIVGADKNTAKEFERRLIDEFSAVPARTSNMAVTLLLLAVGMLVVPMLMIAHHVPEIARIISDFWR